ncbi:MAG: hypothetical protein M3Z95_05995, partial [Actinomycetota bacterium]|nr:hypothetical protein [Actinomycetota bacterium]
MRWIACLGAVTAEALAAHGGVTVASARGRLRAGEGARLLRSRRPLLGQPALYTVTPAGLRAAGLSDLDPCRVSASNALHLITCAGVAVALERSYPDQRVQGERELRREERRREVPLASARLPGGPDGAGTLHRPDLVLWPREQDVPTPVAPQPVAVEVELTVKAPRRLADICRAWARARCVAGVIYLAAPEVQGALERAIERADAVERV